MKTTGVAIIGAGPSGLHAASLLASAGVEVAVMESRAAIGDHAICSGVVGEEAFARFNLPTDPVLSSIYSIQAISPQGKVLRHESATPLARVVNKPEFNRALGRRAAAAGAEFRMNCVVQSVEPEKEGVTLRYSNGDGSPQSMRAQVAVIASGVNASITRPLGFLRPAHFLNAIQADLQLPNGHPVLPTNVYVGQSVAPGAFGWQIPLGHGNTRLGLMATSNPEPYFLAMLRRIAPSADLSGIKLQRKSILQALPGKCSAERVLAIGEVGGHVKTSTGGGIYYGLLSAEFAVEVTLKALRNSQFSASGFSAFEGYCHSAFGNELTVGYYARRLASCLSDTQIEKIFEAVLGSGLLQRIRKSLTFDWHRRALLTVLRSLMGSNGNGLGSGKQ